MQNQNKLVKLQAEIMIVHDLVTSPIVSVPKSFLHCIMSAHICLDFSISNFLAFRNLHVQFPKYYGKAIELLWESYRVAKSERRNIYRNKKDKNFHQTILHIRKFQEKIKVIAWFPRTPNSESFRNSLKEKNEGVQMLITTQMYRQVHENKYISSYLQKIEKENHSTLK